MASTVSVELAQLSFLMMILMILMMTIFHGLLKLQFLLSMAISAEFFFHRPVYRSHVPLSTCTFPCSLGFLTVTYLACFLCIFRTVAYKHHTKTDRSEGPQKNLSTQNRLSVFFQSLSTPPSPLCSFNLFIKDSVMHHLVKFLWLRLTRSHLFLEGFYRCPFPLHHITAVNATCHLLLALSIQVLHLAISCSQVSYWAHSSEIAFMTTVQNVTTFAIMLYTGNLVTNNLASLGFLFLFDSVTYFHRYRLFFSLPISPAVFNGQQQIWDCACGTHVFSSFLLILFVGPGLLNASPFWVRLLNVTFSYSSCAFECVAPNWTKSCRSGCWTSAFMFWKNCGCLQSSVLCFGAQSMQSWWMPKVQALSNCFLPQANPRARQSSSAPDALYLKPSKWWESHRHLGVKDGISLSTTSSVEVRAPLRSADTRRCEPAPGDDLHLCQQKATLSFTQYKHNTRSTPCRLLDFFYLSLLL